MINKMEDEVAFILHIVPLLGPINFVGADSIGDARVVTCQKNVTPE